MKVRRLELIEMVQAEIDDRIKNCQDDYLRRVKEHEKARQDYIVATQEAWRTFSNNLYDAYSTNKPVTDAMVPSEIRESYGFGGRLKLFDDTEPTMRQPALTELQRLMAFLKTVTDDEVSTYQLKEMGFTIAKIWR